MKKNMVNKERTKSIRRSEVETGVNWFLNKNRLIKAEEIGKSSGPVKLQRQEIKESSFRKEDGKMKLFLKDG